MSLITININAVTDLAPVLARLDDIVSQTRAIAGKVNTMANDFTALQATIDALSAKVAENGDTLAGLAQAVIDLKGAVDQQPAIDALVVKAQAILDKITADEDAADDQLPPPAPV